MSLFNLIRSWFIQPAKSIQPINDEDSQFLEKKVAFYRSLTPPERQHFERCCLLFLDATELVGHHVDVDRHDALLIASGSVILAWGFEQWHYVNVDSVILVPGSFNERSEFGKPDSTIQGLVGNQHLAGKMIISKPALHAGFANDFDKQNVVLHEFAHLIDMADGDVDGLPKQLMSSAFSLPWLDFVKTKIEQIDKGKSNIRQYGATNDAEFFSVATEYFFERPAMMRNKHPKLYQALTEFYQQDRADIKESVRIRKKGPCPCGSGKRYKRCCLPK